MIPLFSATIANQGFDLAGAVARVLDSHWYVLGKEVAQFESEFAGYLATRHCISVANGTDALELGLRACGVAAGDRVACVANAGFYASTAAHAIGAVPVYVEVDEQTLTMSVAALSAVLASRPAAVVVTHLYGQLAQIEEIARLCREAGVPLLEDCAQSHGARRHGRMGGSFGDVGCFSFYPTKNLGAVGDGGAIVTNKDNIAAKLRALRQYGWSGKYEVAHRGGRNSRLDEIQAAVLREKLPHLDRQNGQRLEIARRYNAAFSTLPIRCPSSVGEDFAAHLYVIRTDRRDALRTHLRNCGVASDVHYPVPDHLQPAYAQSAGEVRLPVTEAACASILTLPCYPGMPGGEADEVVVAVASFFRTGR